jgi:hypothetical protein
LLARAYVTGCEPRSGVLVLLTRECRRPAGADLLNSLG